MYSKYNIRINRWRKKKNQVPDRGIHPLFRHDLFHRNLMSSVLIFKDARLSLHSCNLNLESEELADSTSLRNLVEGIL